MNTIIRSAQKKDIPALCKIWAQCFNDSEEYINYFYSENFSRIEILVFCVDEKPVSAVHLLSASFTDGDKSQKAKLVYATGTLPERRKNGYMGELIKNACEEAKQKGYALFLKPSSPPLVDYYKKFGFEIASRFSLATIYPADTQGKTFSEISYEEYNKMRNMVFSNMPCVKWENEHLKWCVEENEFFGGKTLAITLDGEEHFIMAYPEEKTLVITETSLSYKQLKQISADLCDIFASKLIKAYMPFGSCEDGEDIISAVIYNSQICNPYVNLILI